MKVNTNKKKRQAIRRRRYKRQSPGAANYIETFITQCIVSGIVLSMVLVLRIIDVPATNTVRDQFRHSISSNIDFPDEARNLGAIFQATLGSIGNGNSYQNDSEERPMTDQENLPAYTGNPAQDFRIDEEILQRIQAQDYERLSN